MSKRFAAVFLTVLCVLLCAQNVFAAEAFDEKAFDVVNDRLITLSKSVLKLADSIAAYNKHVFEAMLTKKERKYDHMEEGYTQVFWNRVWCNGKTITLSGAGQNKKFQAYIFETADPLISFAGNIHVGASRRDLEKFLGMSLDRATRALKQVYAASFVKKGSTVKLSGPVEETDAPEYPIVTITLVDDVITDIALSYHDLDLMGCISQKAVNFAVRKGKEMRLSLSVF